MFATGDVGEMVSRADKNSKYVLARRLTSCNASWVDFCTGAWHGSRNM